MAFFRQWLLGWFILVLGGGTVLADSAREQRIFNAAAGAFNGGLWTQAEMDLTQFLQSYPDSTNAPEAGLLLAQAQIKQGDFTNALSTLTGRQAGARNLADQYLYWIGESQFARGDFAAAAGSFDLLAGKYPASVQCLQALVDSAAARVQLADWTAAEKSLATNAVFQQALQTDPDSELVLRGQLLQAQARFAQKNYSGADMILRAKNPQALPPALQWPWAFLFCQVRQAAGDLNGALTATTNLLSIASVARNDEWTAAGVALRAGLLEQAGQTNAALEAYAENLKPGVPDGPQQQAVLKIAQLSLAQGRYPDTETNLKNFIAQFPASPAADVALLTLGELRLRDYAASPAETNELQLAQVAFSQFLGVFTNSPQAGRAWLGRGWCNWFAGKLADSQSDFAAAVDKLPVSEDQAVARFKLGDTRFAQNDFSGALASYRAVLDNYDDFPAVRAWLGARALYQILRADLALNDWLGASNTLEKIETFYPGDPANVGSTLLLGEDLTEAQQPAWARMQLRRIAAQFPDSPLRPEVQLAIARTFEAERNWPAAIAGYLAWQKNFPTNALRPEVDYLLALANFQAGNETNALTLFAGFLAQNPANSSLAPQAQWWVADHFYRAGDFSAAETNYEAVFQNTNWQSSPLFYPAQLMAGRSAMARQGFSDAQRYFVNLINDTNCPINPVNLRVQAQFACGVDLMQMPAAETNPFVNFQAATNIFGLVAAQYPTNDLGARAWGEIANCALQMNDLAGATNAYFQVINSTAADVAARSGAQVGLGIVLEKMAQSPGLAGGDRTNLLNQALTMYWNVLSAAQDPFWTKKAGLQGAPLVGLLYDTKRQKTFYRELEKALPQLKDSLEKKIAALPPDSQ